MDLNRRTFLAAQGAALGLSLCPQALLAAAAAKVKAPLKLDDWNEVRKLFRLTPEYSHLSGFFFVSHPEPVRAALEAFRDALDANPFLVVEHGMFGSDSENLQIKVCEDIAAYLGGKPDEIALTSSTTESLALVYHGLQLKPGDEVLATTHDHSSHHESIRLSTERNGASWRRIALFEDAATVTVDGIVARVRKAITPATRVLGVTWVLSQSGVRLPIKKIAEVLKEINAKRDEATRVLLVVDGVHGFGAVDEVIAELGCDFFCAGTHKWMFAPRGTGIIWARAENWARLRPLIPSFSNLEVYVAWMQGRAPKGPNTASRVTPGGFRAYEHQWAMGAAFRLHQQIGRARIGKRISELNDLCKQRLAALPKVKLHTPRDPSLSAGICCFEVAGLKPEEVVKKLLERKIIASSSPYAVSYARLAPSLLNTSEEVENAVRAVAAL